MAPAAAAPVAPVAAAVGSAVVDEAYALPPLAAYTPGVLTAPAQLASLPGTSHLTVVLQTFNVDRFDALWGKSAQAVLAAYPGAKADEASDIRPFQQVLVFELPEKDKVGKPLKLDFTFINDQLFQIGLRQGALNKDEKKDLETLFGRPFDRQTEEGWKVKTYCWDDGNLVVKMREKEKLRALVVADRARHEVNAEWDRRPYAAWLANERGAQEHMKHPISFRAAEKGYNDALALFPAMGHALVNLCHLHYDEESLSRALERCNEVLRVSKAPAALAEAQLYLGRIAMAQGRREDALTAFNAAASATIKSDWLLEEAHRHIDLIEGKVKKADLQAVLEDALCAQIESGPTRVRMIVGTYGFASLEDLSYKALSVGVDTVGVEGRVLLRCRQ